MIKIGVMNEGGEEIRTKDRIEASATTKNGSAIEINE
jgi:hypothetical protein